MAHFFIDIPANRRWMPRAETISLSASSTTRLGMYGALLPNGGWLRPEVENEAIAFVARDPFGREIPTYSTTAEGHILDIGLIVRREGSTRIIARAPDGGNWGSSIINVSSAVPVRGTATLRLHDTRLSGRLPAARQGESANVITNGSVSLRRTFESVRGEAMRLRREAGGRDLELEIYCHGGHAAPSQRPQNASSHWPAWLLDLVGSTGQGGAGLFLGAENLTWRNVQHAGLERLQGLFSRIVIYACGAAYIEPGALSGLAAGNGWALCSEIARQTQTQVRASSAIQRYTAYPGDGGAMDFGEWEGTVYTFEPRPV